MKRMEDELYYDYQARRLLSQQRVAILALGLPHWISCTMVKVEGSQVLHKLKVQGTYIRTDKFRKQLTKKNKKAFKKAKRSMAFARQREEAIRLSVGYNDQPLLA